ncbi:hypothetical protein CHS0354_006834 [Potamilus streckersoni]|uniref:Sulphur transport domain-containing protein n=1 Tax=Potamilus streckersoni TaxID=2493646 RepID=A0AAE0TF70_9BIVA|nr:hypothetical protein CHS0354_006834 [Potamilus streckersoni]
MQLGGGCGSGTLFTAAGGNPRMILVLVFFIAGSFLGSLHLPFWLALPGINPVVIYKHAGIIGGWLVQLFLIATVLYGIVKYESSAESTPAKKAQKWVSVGNTAGFTLWGGKIAQALGFPLEGYPYWQWENNSYALQMPLISDVTSVLNIGIIIGATTAALVIGNFGKNLTAVGLKSALAAVIGGLVMGYGARLSFGCNIGAFFSGTVSGSIHGWVWFLAAFAGTFPGIKLRAAFGLKL